MITVTEAAAVKIKNLLEREDVPESGLRMKVVGGGCSGLQYQLGFENGPGEDDDTIESHGVRVFVDMKSALFLAGSELDYDDGLMGAGFRVVNPNAKNQCGCGESFGV
jgi:iron-sulfur cluster assembly accessory protein